MKTNILRVWSKFSQSLLGCQYAPCMFYIGIEQGDVHCDQLASPGKFSNISNFADEIRRIFNIGFHIHFAGFSNRSTNFDIFLSDIRLPRVLVFPVGVFVLVDFWK